MNKELLVPDIGDFDQVEIIEVLVKVGSKIGLNDPVVTLESDKSSVEVPSPLSGKISSLKIKVGDKVTMHGFAGRDDRRMLSIINITLTDGTILVDKVPE